LEERDMQRPIVPVKRVLKSVDEIKDAIVLACRIMEHFDMVQGFGHVSSRIPGTDNIIVTPKKPIGLVKREELILMDMNGKKLQSQGTPMGEIAMHLGIYRKRPDIGAICRFHSEMLSVFGTLNRSVRPVHVLGYVLGPEVKVLNHPDNRHTPAMTDEMGLIIKDNYGVIFRGNGAATFGTNVIDACVRALLLNESACIQYKASLIGTPLYLTDQEMDSRNEVYWNMPEYCVYGRAWDFYTSKVT
jgi:ribulose-5-phosphate 4-epimerase/fuculose-1-phosphate aldolase